MSAEPVNAARLNSAPLSAAGVAVPQVQPERSGHLRVVDPERRRRARSLRVAVWGLGVVAAAAVFGAVAFHVYLAQSQVRLDRLNSQIVTAQHDYEQIRLQVAEASAPEAIVDRAHALGMVEPAAVTYLTAPTATTADDAAPDRGWATVKPHLAPQR